MTLKIAVVGMGGIGNRHASVYRDHEKTEVAAVVDAIPEKAEKAAEAFKGAAFTSVQEMLSDGV